MIIIILHTHNVFSVTDSNTSLCQPKDRRFLVAIYIYIVVFKIVPAGDCRSKAFLLCTQQHAQAPSKVPECNGGTVRRCMSVYLLFA